MEQLELVLKIGTMVRRRSVNSGSCTVFDSCTQN
jgi:hypothetical protein